MRSNYPISSRQFNDEFLTAYSHLVYLLGYDSDDNRYSGLYEKLEVSGYSYLTNSSGIPHIGNYSDAFKLGIDETNTSEQIILYLKWDYIYKKYLGVIQKER